MPYVISFRNVYETQTPVIFKADGLQTMKSLSDSEHCSLESRAQISQNTAKWKFNRSKQAKIAFACTQVSNESQELLAHTLDKFNK